MTYKDKMALEEEEDEIRSLSAGDKAAVVVVLAFLPPTGLVLNAFLALLFSPRLWCGQVITHKLHNESSL